MKVYFLRKGRNISSNIVQMHELNIKTSGFILYMVNTKSTTSRLNKHQICTFLVDTYIIGPDLFFYTIYTQLLWSTHV